MKLKKSLAALGALLILGTANLPMQAFADQEAAEAPIIDLAISDELHIANPSGNVTLNYANYYLTGTSNPDSELYCNGEKVATRGQSGTFGLYVSLKTGANKFTFTQDDGSSQTVTITRGAPSSGAPQAIAYITQTSMYPSYMTAAKPGASVTLSCIAPSGASVTAVVNGKNVRLTQKAATAVAGIPATFTGTYVVPEDFPSDEMTSLGNIQYKLRYKDVNKTYASTGKLYVKGEDAKPAVVVSDTYANVFAKADSNSVITGTYQKGTRDYVQSESGAYCQLKSGGYVHKSVLDYVEGKGSLVQKASGVKYRRGDKSESYVIKNVNNVPFSYEMKDGKFYVTLYNTTNGPKLKTDYTKIFSSITTTTSGTTTTFIFTPKPGESIWGYNVEDFGEDGTRIYFHRKPKAGTGSTPLDGITVVVDAGHGGSDPGAPGAAGKYGPYEADLNLATAYAAKQQLEKLGATVYMTRTDDSDVYLVERSAFTQKYKPDIFVSLHHNSVGLTSNAGTATGTEVYYNTFQSYNYASNVVTAIAGRLGRTNRGVKRNGFYVNRMTSMPAILVEIGFLTNPVEYDKCADSSTINNTAYAVAQGILKTIS